MLGQSVALQPQAVPESVASRSSLSSSSRDMQFRGLSLSRVAPLESDAVDDEGVSLSRL